VAIGGIPEEFELHIKFNTRTNDCFVSGKLKNKELCYRALELAKDVLDQQYRKMARELAQQPGIVQADVEGLKRMLRNGG